MAIEQHASAFKDWLISLYEDDDLSPENKIAVLSTVMERCQVAIGGLQRVISYTTTTRDDVVTTLENEIYQQKEELNEGNLKDRN